MIKFKELRNKINDLKSKKNGLQHPENIDHTRNQPRRGKDLNSVPVPIDVHDEFKGKKGRHTLRSNEQGKYEIEKH